MCDWVGNVLLKHRPLGSVCSVGINWVSLSEKGVTLENPPTFETKCHALHMHCQEKAKGQFKIILSIKKIKQNEQKFMFEEVLLPLCLSFRSHIILYVTSLPGFYPSVFLFPQIHAHFVSPPIF